MKNYLRKLAFIAFFGMIISGCEKDLYEDNIKQQNTKYTYLTGKEALDVTNLLAQKMGENKRISGRGLDLEDYGVVKYDVVMKVIDSLGNKTFTFRVNHPLATSEKFYNMVLQQKIDGLTMVKFYEYNMTTQFAEKYNKGEKEIKDFQGTYNVLPLAAVAYFDTEHYKYRQKFRLKPNQFKKRPSLAIATNGC